MTSCSKMIFRRTSVCLAGISALALIGLTGCASGSQKDPNDRDFLSKVFRPYRPDVVQGNFISREQMDTVRVGMSKDQIKQLLGTPLLTDIFHSDRWDYVFSYKRGDTQEADQRKVTLYFKGLILEKIDAEPVPRERELVAEIDELRKGRKPQKPPVAASLDGPPPAKTVPSVPNPTEGVGIPVGGTRHENE